MIEMGERDSGSPNATLKSFERLYWLRTTAGEDEYEVHAHIEGNTDALYDVDGTGLFFWPRSDIRKEVIQNCGDIEYWGVGVLWGPPTPQTQEDNQYRFDTSGRTQHITTSLGTISNIHAGVVGSAPDYKGLINVHDDQVDGLDIPISGRAFEIIRVVDAADVDDAFEENIEALTAKVHRGTDLGGGNFAPFEFTCRGVVRSRASGSVVFLGATGDERADGKFVLTYKFESTPNVVDYPIGDTGVTVTKEGYVYLWIVNKTTYDAAAKMTVITPDAGYLEKVLDYADLNDLGL